MRKSSILFFRHLLTKLFECQKIMNNHSRRQYVYHRRSILLELVYISISLLYLIMGFNLVV